MRKILIELEIDWEDSEDVCDEIMVEDAIQAKCEGVGWKLVAPQQIAKAKELETLESLLQDMKSVYPEYYTQIITDRIDIIKNGI